MNKENRRKGFSLLEVLIAVAIFSIVMIALFTFMNAITKQYTKNNSEVSVQNEVQTLMAHIQDLIVSADTNVGVSGNCIIMVDDDDFKVIEYDSVNQYLYYYDMAELGVSDAEQASYKALSDREAKLKAAAGYVTTYHITDSEKMLSDYLMTEYVSNFVVDTSHINEDYLAIYVTLAKDSVTYTASKNIYLRNKLHDVDEYGVSSGNSKTDATTAASSASENAGDGGSGSGDGGSGDGSGDTTETTAQSIQMTTEATEPTTAQTTHILKGISAVYTGGNVYYGTTINASDIIVTALYEDGNNETLDSSQWTSDNGFDANNYQYNPKMKIYYNGYQSEVTIPWYNLTGITAKYIGNTKYVGDTVSSSDFEVYNVYGDGKNEKTTDWTCTQFTDKYQLVYGTNIFNICSSINTSVSATAIELPAEYSEQKTVTIHFDEKNLAKFYPETGGEDTIDGFTINDEAGWQRSRADRTVVLPSGSSLTVNGVSGWGVTRMSHAYSYSDLSDNCTITISGKDFTVSTSN